MWGLFAEAANETAQNAATASQFGRNGFIASFVLLCLFVAREAQKMWQDRQARKLANKTAEIEQTALAKKIEQAAQEAAESIRQKRTEATRDDEATIIQQYDRYVKRIQDDQRKRDERTDETLRSLQTQVRQLYDEHGACQVKVAGLEADKRYLTARLAEQAQQIGSQSERIRELEELVEVRCGEQHPPKPGTDIHRALPPTDTSRPGEGS